MSSYQQYILILKKYPEEVGYYFSTDLNGRNNKEIIGKYDLPDNFLYDLVYDIVGGDFNFNNLENTIKKEPKIDSNKTKELSLDIIGMIFLPIEPFMKGKNITGELVKRGGKYEDYKKYVNEYQKLLQDELEKALDDFVENHDKIIDIKEEEEIALDLVGNRLVDVLKGGTPESLSVLNGGLIYLLNNAENFKTRILKKLLSNQEKITSKKITVKQKEVAPTVSNWINDLIYQKGISDLSQMDLSDYLIKSKNVKNLDQEEKELIIKLLNFYRNLKLYPYILNEMPDNAWEIIPVGEVKKEEKTESVKSPAPQQKETQQSLEPKQAQKKPQPVDSISSFKKANTSRLPRIEELKEIAVKYPEGSLERKAVEEEIKRMEGK